MFFKDALVYAHTYHVCIHLRKNKHAPRHVEGEVELRRRDQGENDACIIVEDIIAPSVYIYLYMYIHQDPDLC